LRVPEIAGARERPIRFEEYPALGAVVEAWVLWLDGRAEIIRCQHPQASKGCSMEPNLPLHRPAAPTASSVG
jgi:hypothetical protein